MIRFLTGNILESQAEALVNTVNTEGVMGKGIALHFKERFAGNYQLYRAACKLGAVRVGAMFVTQPQELVGPKYVINFPTKTSWRMPSELAYIKLGLTALTDEVANLDIRSVAIPPLGCGNGGLNWGDVRPLIEAAFAHLPDVDVLVFEPAATRFGERKIGSDVLTPTRALMFDAIRRYGILDGDCTPIEAQKLAYLVNRVAAGLGTASPLKMTFSAQRYGPYADALRHVLMGMDGSFLDCDVRIADAGVMDVLRISNAQRDRVRAYLAAPPQLALRAILDAAEKLWTGFETPFDMELLATVDWIQNQHIKALTPEQLLAKVREWPHPEGAMRKLRLFDLRSVQIALERLLGFQNLLYQKFNRQNESA